jgi:Acetylornithine deacetylase/Succinyl-diaminopimelate desuccinylase and related deacylases
MGCLGAPRMIADIAANLPKPAIVIVGEPTRLKLGNRHKGCYGFQVEIQGRDGHSSATHRGVNAVSHAAEVIRFLDSIAERHRREGPSTRASTRPIPRSMSARSRAGSAVNIIPRHCRIGWEFRPIPASSRQA